MSNVRPHKAQWALPRKPPLQPCCCSLRFSSAATSSAAASPIYKRPSLSRTKRGSRTVAQFMLSCETQQIAGTQSASRAAFASHQVASKCMSSLGFPSFPCQSTCPKDLRKSRSFLPQLRLGAINSPIQRPRHNLLHRLRGYCVVERTSCMRARPNLSIELTASSRLRLLEAVSSCQTLGVSHGARVLRNSCAAVRRRKLRLFRDGAKGFLCRPSATRFASRSGHWCSNYVHGAATRQPAYWRTKGSNISHLPGSPTDSCRSISSPLPRPKGSSRIPSPRWVVLPANRLNRIIRLPESQDVMNCSARRETPNHSIELTSNGRRPSSAAHVKR
jgi:hypothetical protein